MENIDAFTANVELLIDRFFAYVQYMNYYLIGLAVAIVVIIVMGIAILQLQNRIIKQNEYIMSMIESRTLKGGKENG